MDLTALFENAFVAAIVGGLAGAAASYGANTIQERRRVRRLTSKLRVEKDQPHEHYGRCRVINAGEFPMRSAVAYISIAHGPGDIVNPPVGWESFVTPDSGVVVTKDRLCWSLAAPVRNPYIIDICPGESQALSLYRVRDDDGFIHVPSEKGWGPKEARILLRVREYRGTLEIVSLDTRSREFHFKLDPKLPHPLEFEPAVSTP